MQKRSLLLFLAVIFLIAVSSTFALAITATTPDEYVRGLGSIVVSNTSSIGRFGINVAKSNNEVLGSFNYKEASTSSRVPGTTIYSTRIVALEIRGNTAVIKATGYRNNILSDLTIEVLDDDPSGDWISITATPRYLLLPTIVVAGGVKDGNIIVYSKLPPDVYAKGEGTIAVGANSGAFKLHAERIKNVTQGSIYYVENSLFTDSIMPKAVIQVPSIAKMNVIGNSSVLAGKGTLNGRPVLVTVNVVDNSMRATLVNVPDMFSIRAFAATNTAYSSLVYSAGGPLTSGDISLGFVTQ